MLKTPPPKNTSKHVLLPCVIGNTHYQMSKTLGQVMFVSSGQRTRFIFETFYILERTRLALFFRCEQNLWVHLRASHSGNEKRCCARWIIDAT